MTEIRVTVPRKDWPVRRGTRPPQRRRSNAPAAHTGKEGGRRGAVGDAVRPRLPRAPAPARAADLARDADAAGAAGAGAPAVVGLERLLVNGADTAFRRMLRGLAGVVRRTDTVHDLAGKAVGLSGTRLEFLLAVAEYGAAAGIGMTVVSRRLDISPYYAHKMATELERKGLMEKRVDPANRKRRLLALTEEGRRAAEAAAGLVAGALNLAFAPLTAREFAALRRIAAKLDESSAHAVDILARLAGEDTYQSRRALMAAMRRLGGK